MNEVLGLWNAGEDRFHSRLSAVDAKRIIKAAYRKGISTFDSAYSYLDADTLLRSALAEMNAERKDWKIIEKIMPVPTLGKKADTILGRLGTDYVDVLLIHWPAEDESINRALNTLEALKAKGKAKEIGVSNFPLELLKRIRKDYDITYHERPLSLVWNRDYREEKELGLKTLAYAPLGFGILGGTERREKLEALPYAQSDTLRKLLRTLGEKAERHNTTPAAISYAWVREHQPWAVIRGVSSPAQLDIPSVTLTDDEERELTSLADEITSEAGSDNIFGHDWKGGRR